MAEESLGNSHRRLSKKMLSRYCRSINGIRCLSSPASTEGSNKFDLICVGGGIVGFSSAREILLRHPHLKIAIVEKERKLAFHQSGHNRWGSCVNKLLMVFMKETVYLSVEWFTLAFTTSQAAWKLNYASKDFVSRTNTATRRKFLTRRLASWSSLRTRSRSRDSWQVKSKRKIMLSDRIIIEIVEITFEWPSEQLAISR